LIRKPEDNFSKLESSAEFVFDSWLLAFKAEILWLILI